VLDLAGEYQTGTQSEMPLQHVKCLRAELDQAVLTVFVRSFTATPLRMRLLGGA
jgi:hypothetical protein